MRRQLWRCTGGAICGCPRCVLVLVVGQSDCRASSAAWELHHDGVYCTTSVVLPRQLSAQGRGFRPFRVPAILTFHPILLYAVMRLTVVRSRGFEVCGLAFLWVCFSAIVSSMLRMLEFWQGHGGISQCKLQHRSGFFFSSCRLPWLLHIRAFACDGVAVCYRIVKHSIWLLPTHRLCRRRSDMPLVCSTAGPLFSISAAKGISAMDWFGQSCPAVIMGRGNGAPTCGTALVVG